MRYLCRRIKQNNATVRGVAQLAARHVRDVEVGSSSLLTPTKQDSFSGHRACETVIVYIYMTTLRYETD